MAIEIKKQAPSYRLDAGNKFVIEAFEKAKPFSSFLPGIAGVDGVPLWLFYVNRGQAVASFGVEDKNGAMMEFFPADKSYRQVGLQGFRTFMKLDSVFYEPFSEVQRHTTERRTMQIAPNLLRICSVHEAYGIEVEISYFTVPGDKFAALVRDVTVTNRSDRERRIELLDGMPAVIPFGIENLMYKELGNTLKSWMDVYNREEHVPLFKLRASTADTAEVSEIQGGHFYMSFASGASDPNVAELLQPIVDAGQIFGQNTSFTQPDAFLDSSLGEVLAAELVTTNKVPCAFSGTSRSLRPGASLRLTSLLGHTTDIARINARKRELCDFRYVDRKRREAEALVDQLTATVATDSAEPLFNAYTRQNYLDNLLRGGYPLLFERKGGEPAVYHVFSRKHGDLERDYNFFKLQPGYYSQGNGNFRDANQNRRSDIFFEPQLGDFNVWMFMSLIQTDGYNPLVVKGCSFRLRDAAEVLANVHQDDAAAVADFLKQPYTPGDLLQFLERGRIRLTVPARQLLEVAIAGSEQSIEADFGEGYWIDHWTYNMDLIESYLAVYPDRKAELLQGERRYAFYDSPAFVRPRADKYVLAAPGKVRQFSSVEESAEKEALLHARSERRTWARSAQGQGDVYETNLLAKLVLLAAVKFAALDPEGLGVQMEANKPGWNDSLNGLPGLFASGFSETCELKRVVRFLRGALADGAASGVVRLPIELCELLAGLEAALADYAQDQADGRDYRYWDRSHQLLERYRSRVFLGFDGAEQELALPELERLLAVMDNKLEQAMERALVIGQGLYPTYFYYEAAAYEAQTDEHGQPRTNAKGLPLVNVTAFRRVDVPHFLEGPTRALKVIGDGALPKQLHERVHASGLYDRKLGMYKVNESLLGQPMDLGRSTAFTPGWLENESVFMHMEYKYLLALLRAGLYADFYRAVRTAWPIYHDPAVYGRNVLENSSFIASSANPDPGVHGTGFVARLSGSTAEFLSMWVAMMAGDAPFVLRDGQLALSLRPALPGSLFKEDGTLSFTFLGRIPVIYRHPAKTDTFTGREPGKVLRYRLTYGDGRVELVEGADVKGELAEDIRSRHVVRLEAELS
ncbi:cellobiose phosphorylase [Paenibacillus athensensis]|uniref:Cellobiose phosphorylase n=1 Tax=Paenibacillus athensensis TaxID=1967502 RepID=A0A4Y8Q9F5_9BACL|nr:cellobiose phosphorylase [Paenibacillus athensensis]MCD1260003.1 cellobiose phosphorylase [Paenibacillus athensensis]